MGANENQSNQADNQESYGSYAADSRKEITLTSIHDVCPKLEIKKKYLKIGSYLPWRHLEGYFVYFKVGSNKMLHVEVNEEVYKGLWDIEGKIIYSDSKFKKHNNSLEALHNEWNEADYFIDRDCPLLNGLDKYADMTNIIHKMPLRNRKIVQLRLDGYKEVEIADELCCSLRTIERRLAAIKVDLLDNIN